ncbi:MAG: histidine kinase [Bacteroidota bacterium]
MQKLSKQGGVSNKEVIFQLVLHGVVFIFYAFSRNDSKVDLHEVLIFGNLAIAALTINYLLLPKVFYPKKYFVFLGYVLLLVIALIGMEELVIEKIFFPDTRGKTFGGVFFTLLNILPVLTILTGFKFGWDALVKQREVEELTTIVKESELQYLKSQINPHFLFNNLNNLYAYAVDQSPKTPEIILELSGVLRYMLYECREKYVPLKKEVEQLNNFILLNELQIEDRGKVSFIAEHIREQYRIAPLILMVFVENAFKHSTASQSDNIVINVSISLSDAGVLNFLCENTYHKEKNTDSLAKGIGLENVVKRLELLYPDAHHLAIFDEHNFYKVHLTIDLDKLTRS